MPTFTITNTDVGSGDFNLDLRNVGEAAGVGTGLEMEDAIVVTIAADPGLNDITDLLIKGIGDEVNDGDVDIITFDLSTFSDSFNLVLSPGGGAPGSDDIVIFDGATSVTDNGGGLWTVTYFNGGTEYTINLDAQAAQVQLVNPAGDGVVDGEDTGETMNPGYNDDNAPTDGNGDIIDGADGNDDSIRGNGGNDTIDAGFGDDTVEGGLGNDVVGGDAGHDVISGDDMNDPAAINITNASFESTTHAEGDFSAGIPGWTINGTDIGDYNPTSSEINESTVTGSNVAYLNDDGDRISQTLDTTYEDGATYTFNVDLGDGDYGGGDSSNYTVNIYAGATLIGTTSGSTGDIDALSTVSVSSTVSNPALNGQDISIEIVKNSGGELLVDNVQGTVSGGTLEGSDDSLSGGSGNDTIYGDFNDASMGRAGFLWNDIPDPDNGGQIDNGDEITSGSQVAGNVTVNYNFTGVSGQFTDSTQYVTGIDAGTDTVDNDSALSFEADGSGEISFSSAVENVEFRINDFEDQLEDLTIRVYDENNQLTTFTVTRGSEVSGSDTDAVAGEDTFEGVNGSSNSDSSAQGSILVEIPGPASRIEFDFNTSGGTLTLTDIWFDDPATGTAAGDDTIDGGDGDDILYGNGGNDVLTDSGTTTAAGTQSQTWAITGEGELYLYDPNTGTTTLQQSGLAEYGDIATGADGTLYGVIFNSGASSNAGIYSINTDTGAETLVYDLTDASGFYAGLGTDPSGNLYLIDNDLDQITQLIPDGGGGFTDGGTSLGNVPGQGYDVTFIDSDTAWVTSDTGIYSYDVDGSGNFSGQTSLGTIGGSNTIFGLHIGADGLVYAVDADGSVFSTDPNNLPPVWSSEPAITDTNIFGAAPVPASPAGNSEDELYGGDGDDTLDGGFGADTLSGDAGNDVLFVDQGDSAQGGDGDDTFILQDLDTTGTGNASIDIIGGEGDETNGDTLQLTPDVTFGDITFTNTNDAAGGLSGNFTMADGTVVTFSEIENIICFTSGTLILTNQGERPVESLKRGDKVLTRDHGFQPIRWIGQRAVEGKGRFAPIRFVASALPGASADLLVSPQHRVVFEGYKAQLLFGESEVFAAAKHMVDGVHVLQEEVPSVTYFHIMFDEHEVIYSNGIPTESFHAGDMGLSSITDEARDELFTLFPDLRSWSGGHGPTARSSLKRYEAELLREKLIG